MANFISIGGMSMSPYSSIYNHFDSYGNHNSSYPPGMPFGEIDEEELARKPWLKAEAEKRTGLSVDDEKPEKGDPDYECETCRKRKYKDGSDEMVSFKSPRHVSPESAASAVRAHEQEHVSNAYTKAEKDNGRVLSASVSIHTAVCPECGRTYVSGGTTHTQIKYFNEDNPYQKDLKAADHAKYAGMNLDYAV